MDAETEYRLPTEEEKLAMDPLTPRVLSKKIYVDCPSGESNEMTIRYVDGTEFTYLVLRVLISMEQNEPVKAHLSQFNKETGRIEFEQAECLVGSNAEGDALDVS